MYGMPNDEATSYTSLSLHPHSHTKTFPFLLSVHLFCTDTNKQQSLPPLTRKLQAPLLLPHYTVHTQPITLTIPYTDCLPEEIPPLLSLLPFTALYHVTCFSLSLVATHASYLPTSQTHFLLHSLHSYYTCAYHSSISYFILPYQEPFTISSHILLVIPLSCFSFQLQIVLSHAIIFFHSSQFSFFSLSLTF